MMMVMMMMVVVVMKKTAAGSVSYTRPPTLHSTSLHKSTTGRRTRTWPRHSGRNGTQNTN